MFWPRCRIAWCSPKSGWRQHARPRCARIPSDCVPGSSSARSWPQPSPSLLDALAVAVRSPGVGDPRLSSGRRSDEGMLMLGKSSRFGSHDLQKYHGRESSPSKKTPDDFQRAVRELHGAFAWRPRNVRCAFIQTSRSKLADGLRKLGGRLPRLDRPCDPPDQVRYSGCMARTLSYAQHFEDLHLLRVFGEQPSGFYIDIGAGHPVLRQRLVRVLSARLERHRGRAQSVARAIERRRCGRATARSIRCVGARAGRGDLSSGRRLPRPLDHHRRPTRTAAQSEFGKAVASDDRAGHDAASALRASTRRPRSISSRSTSRAPSRTCSPAATGGASGPRSSWSRRWPRSRWRRPGRPGSRC